MIELNATTLLGIVLGIAAIVFLLLRGRKKDLISMIATVLVVATVLIVATHPTEFASLVTVWIPKAEKAEAAPAPVLATPSPSGEKKALNQASSQPAQVTEKPQPTGTSSFWNDLFDGVVRTVIVAGFFVALIFVLIMLYLIRKRIRVAKSVQDQLCCAICGKIDRVQAYEYRNGRNGRVKGALCYDCAGNLHASLVQ